MEIFKAYQSKDIDKYFRLFKKAPYLISCCCVYTIDEMRKHSMAILSNAVKETVSIGGQPSIKFKIDLDWITDLLWFNNSKEAKEFITTLGYTVAANKTTGILEIYKGGEASEIWKPRTNYKYIEAKKFKGSKIHARSDIIRGLVLTLNDAKGNSLVIEKTVTKPTKPLKREVEKPIVVDDKLEAEKIRAEQEKAKFEARKKLEDELKQKMIAQKEKDRLDKIEKERIEKLEKDQREKEEAILKKKVSI